MIVAAMPFAMDIWPSSGTNPIKSHAKRVEGQIDRGLDQAIQDISMVSFKPGNHFCSSYHLFSQSPTCLLYPESFEVEFEGIDLLNKPATVYWAA
jgi:hypothetical protein